MYFILRLRDGVTKQAVKALSEIEAKRLDGTYEMICDMRVYGTTTSYSNERVMWLGYKLESKGINVFYEMKIEEGLRI